MVKAGSLSSIPLYLFAKAPQPGHVKTRMQSHLSAQQCAQLASLLLLQSVSNAVQYWPGQVVVAYTGDYTNSQFMQIRQQYGIKFVDQGGGDLGQRMQRCLQNGIDSFGAGAVIGCDVPYLDAEIYTQLYQALEQGRSVIGPATDGGFYVLGLSEFKAPLFEQVDWGSERVYAQIMRNADKFHWQWKLLEAKQDIDEWDDLVWLSQHDINYQQFVNVSQQGAAS